MDRHAKRAVGSMPVLSTRIKAVIAFAFVSFIWGSTWSVGKQGVFEMPVLMLSYLRNAIAGAVLVVYFLARGYAVPKGRSLLRMLVLSLFLFVFNTGFSLWSLQFIPAHTAAIIGCTSPLLIHALQIVVHRRQLNAIFILGCLISIAGVTILVCDGSFEAQHRYALGIALSCVGVLAWCVGFVLMEEEKDTTNLYYSFGWQLVFSSGVLYLAASLTGQNLPIESISAKGWLVIGYLSMFGSVLAFVCLAYIMRHLASSTVSLYVFINPVVAVLISIVQFDEQVSLLLLMGSMLAVLGVWISVKTRVPGSG